MKSTRILQSLKHDLKLFESNTTMVFVTDRLMRFVDVVLFRALYL